MQRRVFIVAMAVVLLSFAACLPSSDDGGNDSNQDAGEVEENDVGDTQDDAPIGDQSCASFGENYVQFNGQCYKTCNSTSDCGNEESWSCTPLSGRDVSVCIEL
jgi:hypothetical protein